MLRIAICDDSVEDRRGLRALLCTELERRGEPAAKIVEYAGGEGLLADLEEQYEWFDLLFLDIYMGGLNGIETARRLRTLGQKVPLVFLTSSPDFAVEGYDVAAAGYLLKPLTAARLTRLLERLFAAPLRPRLTLKSGTGRLYFDYDALCYIESQNRSIFLHTVDGATTRVIKKLDEVEAMLGDKRFLRCHQSFLVNMDYIQRVEDDFILRNGSRVPIRVRSRKAMTDAYYSYFIEHAVGAPTGEEGAYV